jgi:hypothetical protein
MSEHKLVFSMVLFSSFVSLGWVLIIYVLSFYAARRLVNEIDIGYVPRRRDLRLARHTECTYRHHSIGENRAHSTRPVIAVARVSKYRL